ncbi:putative ABC transporter related protein [Magnetospirillum gryphiswaldense MSR-1 v2]|uniref:ABC transporter related protein n=1 Tax=Magnetospirillum gryphiswaldense (strain DSM 6361 / JCM 21280 / NBRC 15271 / MSR-1) TaxID=431944 RepID=V6F050_MAGGM|nr:NHLP bacteriocin export ABC transporter permease/ATPase subunit [Magnetospirillum gryphiswaldense]CDK97858.1 putative ABC transporter related protein [Magnetospirillum gryphiswaldense MSR-1 v2]
MTSQAPLPSPFPSPFPLALAQAGQPSAMPANDSLVLTGEAGLWLVEAGEMDIFAVDRHTDGILGVRRHLATVVAPGLMAGMEWPADSASPIEIVAISRDARVRRLDGGALLGLADAAALAALGRALERWIAGLTAGLARFFAPRSAAILPLAPGATIEVAAGALAGCPRGLVWVLVSAGSARYLGVETLLAAEHPLIPLTTDSWLTGDEGLTVAGYSTDGLMRTAHWWPRVRIFHHVWLRALVRSVAQAAKAEEWRLEKRADKTRDAIDGTLTRFARLVGEVQKPAPSHDPDNALAIACAIACQPLGITIEASPLLARRRSADRPLTIEDIARVTRLRVRRVALRGDWWRQDLGPLVGFSDDDGQPVALVPGRDGRYRVHRGTNDRDEPLTEALAAGLQMMAWSFYAPLPEGRLTIRDLLRMGIRNQTADIAVALAAGAAGGLLGLALPLLTSWVFRQIIPGHLESQLVQVGLALVMAAAASTIFKIVGDVALLRIEGRVAGRLQAGIIDRLLRLPSSFFNTYSTGDLALRTLTVEAVRKALTGLVLSSAMAGVFSLFSFALLFWYQPAAALVAGVLFLLVMGVSTFVGARQLKAIYEGEAISGNINSLVLQIVNGIPKLRIAGAEDRAFVLWGKVFAELRGRMVRMRRIANAYAVFLAGYDILSLAVVFLVIALAAGSDMDTGAFLAFVSAFSMFMSSTTQMGRAVIQCFNVAPMVQRAQPLLDALPETDASKNDPGQLTGGIEVTGVVFRYDREGPKVLNGLSLTAGAGQFIALVGPSGCGKSTLMKLLLGFEQPEAGGIFVDGHDLRTLDVQAVRRQVGVVLQSGRLMPGTIYENIKGASEASVDDAWQAAAMAGMDSDIKAMPMGMHTVLTEGSAALSGGQIQRLLIARAVVARPRLLLFDEATSALDNLTQAVVTESLSRLSVTRIAIAHRLSTVRDADRIYVLQEGRVAESGTYTELMARNGLFTELARRQLT